MIVAAASMLNAAAQKTIYVPKDLQQMNLLCDSSTWSYARMTCTDNFAIMWQKGFGYDLSCPSPLEGKPMKVDIENLKEKLENYYAFFRDHCSSRAKALRLRNTA